MSGSLPHSIALSGQVPNNTTTPGYTTFDIRSDEDKNLAALNARNAKASSDLVVTISEEGQALSQHNKKTADEIDAKKQNDMLRELEEEFGEDDLVPLAQNQSTEGYEEKSNTGDFLDQIV
ncbi:MAG: hypothetical protein ACTH58_11465 [Marinomonas foliarum]|jgi:hypothetical protein|uniref:Uncharacterized protein n=1 Tax=Marinomonas foliarum TaxID=491950 RepID=A0A368ZTX2_9GAMM|nr:hypothetical protein [Marinomonas foliarum]QRV24159.1 hypothetical protein JSY38_01045 [Marinomonas foliarum]RCX00425.1 hypothetical protein DFP77_1222 [Marinomonas foliarum]